MRIFPAILASIGVAMVLASAAPARADWDGPDRWRREEWREHQWREHEWRQQAWREHLWREHEWREHHWRPYPPGY